MQMAALIAALIAASVAANMLAAMVVRHVAATCLLLCSYLLLYGFKIDKNHTLWLSSYFIYQGGEVVYVFKVAVYAGKAHIGYFV